MITPSEVISIGTLRRPHGKQGELQCLMYNELWDNADAEFLILRIDNILVPFRVINWRGKGSDILIFQLHGITNEADATRLVGCEAYMLRKDISEEIENTITWQDLVGYTIIDQVQGTVGSITAIDESTINTLAELQDGRLLPLHEDFILSIDNSKHILTLNLPFEL